MSQQDLIQGIVYTLFLTAMVWTNAYFIAYFISAGWRRGSRK